MEQVETLNKFLSDNKLPAKCVTASVEGCLQIFGLETENSFRLNKLSSLTRELAHTLKSYAEPSIKFNLDKHLLQIEAVTTRPQSQSLIEQLSREDVYNPQALNMSLGTTLRGENVVVDMSKNPHLLIGGSTGSGKTALLHNILSNLLVYSESQIYIADTKGIEFSPYGAITDRIKVIDNATDFKSLLKYLIFLMEKRYLLLKKEPWTNPVGNEHFKPIVVIIDEFADLIMQDISKESYMLLCQLVQKSRACGIYCVLATQRPSADIITGLIKANFPARIACKVSSKVDSRIILDENGAETLCSPGEVIIKNYAYNKEKIQLSYSSPNEVLQFLNEKMASNT